MSNSDSNGQNLFEEFPPVSLEEWESVIENDLKGADYKQKLRWDTGEGIEVLPFYRREARETGRDLPIFSKKDGHNKWKICNPVFSQRVDEANEKARHALDRGAQALQFKLQVRSTAGMLGGDLEGTSVQTQTDFNQLVKDIPLHETPLHFDSGLTTPVMLAMLLNETQELGLDPAKVKATFTYDPSSFIATKGQYPKPDTELNNEIVQLVTACDDSLPNTKPLCADARTWHNAGATIVQELALALSGASEFMAVLTDHDIAPDTAADHIFFNFSVGSKYFLEIAKFRALRLLWGQMIEAYGANAENIPAYIFGETSTWNKTLYDPYVNMLRTTTEGMSAAISGIDLLTVQPFDITYKEPDAFSERIARNSQVILQEEAYFDKVADPSAGSYYIEELTDKLADEAWSLFQEFEQEGGLLTSLRNGTVQSLLEMTQEKRDQAIASRGRVFVGTNQFTNPDEEMSGKVESEYSAVSLKETDAEVELNSDQLMASLAEYLREGAALGDLIPQLFNLNWSKHFIRTVSTYRGPEAFEQLRLATERSDKTPRVLTLPLGDRKMRKARSSFANNFFGCVGYNIEDPIGFESVSEAIRTVREQEPDIAVICSSDQEYQEFVPAICEEFEKLSNAPLLVLAGYPEKDIEDYRKAGIDEFIHSRCNVLETLNRFQTRLGII